jgi:hypothetical protein
MGKDSGSSMWKTSGSLCLCLMQISEMSLQMTEGLGGESCRELALHRV